MAIFIFLLGFSYVWIGAGPLAAFGVLIMFIAFAGDTQ